MAAQLLPKLLMLDVGWWAFMTRVNPNKADVTTQHLEAKMWDEKPTY
jgi:hypothetical protein